MKFENPLIEGVFLKRYKRFFADIRLGKETVVAHVPNTGSLKSCNEPESTCLLSPATNPERKLRYTLEMVKTPKSWVGVNTSNPAILVKELFESKKVAHWKNFDGFQSEVKINEHTRLDGAMWNSSEQKNLKNGKLTKLSPPLHFFEIKNVTLAENGTALFPDAVTERGQKHLQEMMDLIKKGFTCEMIYVIQREDCKVFSPADDIDPEYGKILRQAVKKGLRVSALPCRLNEKEIKLQSESLPLNF
ncbi:DNA/RNA nuclease SfsA [bacterium]|nr:DNA/RNA nuclease SfsA [bacterium]